MIPSKNESITVPTSTGLGKLNELIQSKGSGKCLAHNNTFLKKTESYYFRQQILNSKPYFEIQ